MFRTTKRLLIPVLASVSALVIILCILFFVTSNTDDNEIVTVYCVTKANRTGYLTTYSYDEKGRFLEVCKDNGKSVETYSYDEMGNPTHYPYAGGYVDATYDENGNILTYKKGYYLEEYTYDTNGKLIEKKSYYDDIPTRVESNTYDENGKMIETQIYSDDVLTESKHYIYDEDSRKLIGYIHYIICNDESILLQCADYDQNGNQTCYKEYRNGKLWQHSTCQYDNEGRLIVAKSMLIGYLNGKAESKAEYVYDLAGRLIKLKIHSYGDDILVEKPTAFTDSEIDYEYDFFGNLVKETRTSENQVTSIRQWSYDYRGNLVSYSLNNTLMKWYYDRRGNIIKEEYIVDDDVRNTTEYTYKAFTVTQKEAEFIKTQQEEIFFLSPADISPKTPKADALLS